MRAGGAWAVGCGALALVVAGAMVQHGRHAAHQAKARGGSPPREASAPPSLQAVAGFSPDTLDMVSSTSGWAVTTDHVWWTDDGGARWANVTPRGVPSGSILSVEALGGAAAWVAVKMTAQDSGAASMFVTSSHGQTWRQVAVPQSAGGIDFLGMLSPARGFVATEVDGAAGSESIVLEATRDGGRSWTTLAGSISPSEVSTGDKPQSDHPIPFGGDKTGMGWTTMTDGWITGGIAGAAHENAVVLRTTNGGADWYRVTLSQASGAPDLALAPTFFGTQAGIMPVEVDGFSLSFYRTSNGGSTWTAGARLPWEQSVAPSLWSFANAADGLVLMQPGAAAGSASAALYRTDTAGASWEEMSTNLPLTHVVALDAVTPSVAWAATSGSIPGIWKTTDGGAVWRRIAR